MLVIAWDAMNGAIQRIQAEEYLAAYQIAVLATPTSDRNAIWSRQRVIDGWVRLATPVKHAIHTSVAKLREMLAAAFEEQIRD